MQSLCGNSYGCLSDAEGAIGTELDYAGDHLCSRCVSMAKAVVEFFVGEEIEYRPDFEEWMLASKVMDRLLDTLLGRALVAQGLI